MTQVEKQIRELLGDFTRALHDKSARGVIVLLTDDAQFFDLAPPLRLGAEATTIRPVSKNGFERGESDCLGIS